MNQVALNLMIGLKAYAEKLGEETGEYVEITITSRGTVEAVVGDDDIVRASTENVVRFLEGKRNVVSEV